MAEGLNDPSFFRKGGIGIGRINLQVGREPLDGSWYVDLKRDDGQQLHSIITPDQAFTLFKGGLIAMARFQPEKLGEIRSLLQALVPHS